MAGQIHGHHVRGGLGIQPCRRVVVLDAKLLLSHDYTQVAIIRRIVVAAELADREGRPRRRDHGPEGGLRVMSSHPRHHVRRLPSALLQPRKSLVIVCMPERTAWGYTPAPLKHASI